MNSNLIFESIKKEEQVLHVVKANYNNTNLSFLLDFLDNEIEYVNEQLLRNGAVLFRGFDINNSEDFLKVKNKLVGESNFEYVDGNSPRTKLTKNIYTSTEFPKEHAITLHNELSYTNRWPSKLYFFCETPSIDGGETPILDCRYALKILDPELVELFAKLGVKYTRYLHGGKGFGKSWMSTFETSDKLEVEKYCKNYEVNFLWENESLAISQLGLGVATHPITKEKVWFNQANQFHPSSLNPDIYNAVKSVYSKKSYQYPHYAYFGDGQEIPENYLFAITETLEKCSIKFKWQKGDVLFLDNMLMAHGRMPYKGERKILVSMS